MARGLYEEGKEAALRYEAHFRRGEFLPGASGSRNSGAAAGESGSAAHEQGDRDSAGCNQRRALYLCGGCEAARYSAVSCRPVRSCQTRDRMRYEGGQYYVKSEEEMQRTVSICAGGTREYPEDRRPVSCGD